MLKGNNTVKTIQNLSTYKFDTSGYVVLKDGIKRDSSTGMYVNTKSGSSVVTSKSKK